MTPVAYEQTNARRHNLRHVKPFVAGEGLTESEQTLLGRSYAFKWIPVSDQPTSSDYSQGQWTARLGDAGSSQIVWPNTTSSDGLPWRDRFDTYGHLEYIEIYRDDVLEAVDCIFSVAPGGKGQSQVTLVGNDGWYLLKNAYQRDWTCLFAPRDVIEYATYVRVPAIADNFPGDTLADGWTVQTSGAGGSATVSNGLTLTVSGPGDVKITGPVVHEGPGSRWAITAAIQSTGQSPSTSCGIFVETSGDATVGFVAIVGPHDGIFGFGGSNTTTPTVQQPGYNELLLECDGRWVSGYINGTLIGQASVPNEGLDGAVNIIADSTGGRQAYEVANVVAQTFQPLLMRSPDKGDYVLPGTAQTYPTGGLHGRYYNDLDLQNDPARLMKVLAPNRSNANNSGLTPMYFDRLDPDLDGTLVNPLPGAAESNWSCRWFGSIWLALSEGDFTFELATPAGSSAIAAWIGQTQWSAALVQTFAGYGGAETYAFTVDAGALASINPDATITAKDGWYPIIIEYSVDSTVATGPAFTLTNSPAAYIDPGGSAISAGSQSTVVPATSLSPLGLIDQHYQGTAHFDIVQTVANAAGYQITCDPQQLESGYFPGLLIPRLRVGQDTDEIVTPDDIDRTSGLNNYLNTIDATTQLSSLRGNGASVQDANGAQGQLQAEVISIDTLLASLFDLQGWQDSTGTTSTQNLAAILASQLSLQTEPWQNVTGDPIARDRLAETLPLTGAKAQMRWQPGWGLELQLPDVNVWDISPRQILQLTRSFGPQGRTGTQMGFRQRPIDMPSQVLALLKAAVKPQRSYQTQYVRVSAGYVQAASVEASATGPDSAAALSAGEKVVKAVLRITAASPVTSVNVLINGTDVTAALNGPWNAGAGFTQIDVSAYAVPDSDGQCAAALRNNSGGSATLSYQLLIDVLR